MLVVLVLVASVVLQLTAAWLAARLVRITGVGRGWTLIALAVLLMAVRRCVVLYRLSNGDLVHPPDLATELTSLTVSALMIMGIAGIGSIFVSVHRARDMLRDAHDELDRRVAQRTSELAASKRRLEENMADRKRSERELSEIAARQQQKMGQELHDGLGQQLLGLRLMASSLTKLLEARELPEAESARELADGLMGAQQNVRALIKGIRPVEVDAHGLMTGLADLADRTEQLAGVPCVFHCSRPADLENNHTATQLFYIAAEAVGNAVRHARAEHIEISLTRNDQRLQLWIRDDGCGLAGDLEQIAGMGMRIMRHRAAMISAVLTIESAREGGTLVTCVVPVGSL
jgi:signal transduction histidine kinase